MSRNTMTEATAEKTYLGYRLLSAILFASSLVVLFLPIRTFRSAWVVEEASFIKTIQALFASESKMFGLLPAFVEAKGIVGLFTNASFYLFLVSFVVSIIIAFCAIWSKKSAARRTRLAVFFFTLGTAAHTLAIICVSIFVGTEVTYDLFVSILAILGVLVCFALMVMLLGKEAFIRAVQFLLTFIVSGLFMYALIHDGAATKQTVAENATFKWMLFAILAFTILNLVLAGIRTLMKKGLAMDMVRFIMQLIIALLACYVNYAEEFAGTIFLALAIIAGLISLLQIILANLQFENRVKKKLLNAEEETLSGFAVEQYVEAYPYVGGPTDGVEVAEEVTPTAASARGDKPDLATLVGNGFDPFLFTLTSTEKMEFVDLYILRCKCFMPEIPAYVVGGDNKDFFNKVFIYLGQYRDRIPDSLLAKIYQFAIKMN